MWLSAFCMMSDIKGRQLAFVFSYGSLGDLNLGAFGRGVPGGSSGGTWCKSSAQCKDAPTERGWASWLQQSPGWRHRIIGNPPNLTRRMACSGWAVCFLWHICIQRLDVVVELSVGSLTEYQQLLGQPQDPIITEITAESRCLSLHLSLFRLPRLLIAGSARVRRAHMRWATRQMQLQDNCLPEAMSAPPSAPDLSFWCDARWKDTLGHGLMCVGAMSSSTEVEVASRFCCVFLAMP